MEVVQDEKKLDDIKRQLRRIFSEMPTNTKKFANKLIDMAAFSVVSIDNLQQIILEEGYVVEYQNGANQFGTKDNPAVNMRVKEVTTLLKIIDSLSQLGGCATASEELDTFLKRVKR